MYILIFEQDDSDSDSLYSHHPNKRTYGNYGTI